MYYEMNKFHIGKIKEGFEEKIKGIDVWLEEGELIYVLSELFDPEDPDVIIYFVIMLPVVKDVLTVDADFVKVLSRGTVSRFPF
ncbi:MULTISPECIES: hypothetical protein [Bacillaceae]|uniref:Uncharacterized protein n=1 Tax=Lederbergia citri TaxID=2833580 RepID=A0A942YEB5_9BACI|nr:MULTISPECIES: hypothetical protein [Bacillaceae]MBS4193728.1 hypothetical protein [Lederbergia citri]